MRTKTALLATLLLMAGIGSASARSRYADCVASVDPAGCITRKAVNSFGVDPGETLEGVLRHGLVELVPSKTAKLMRGLYGSVGEPDAKVDSPEEQLLDSSASQALRKARHQPVLAAMALVAAARHEQDPFANSVYQKLARQAKDDPRIPLLALALWTEIVGMSGSPPDFRVTHAGLPAIWNRALERKQEDVVLLEDVAGTMAFLGKLMPQMREFFLWYAGRPDLTPVQRVEAASRLARHFGDHETAAKLLADVGDRVEGYDLPGVRAEVARARLAKSYDAEAARTVLGDILDDFGRNGIRFADFNDVRRDVLERAGAYDELRQAGDECLRQAKIADADAKGSAAYWYAMASEFYLRAGDRERARAIARLGLPYVPDLVRSATHDLSGIDKDNPTALAVAAQGWGTAPVIALYRAGAVEEALRTRYLTGKDRFRNAQRAGEKPDPQWVVDDDWGLYIDAMARETADTTDRDYQQRAYDALVQSCHKPIADCFSETLREIAQVAAAMGDEARMKEALGAAARQLDKGTFNGFQALYVAGPWAHCEEILRSAPR
jgi:hypothetical protein